MPLLSHRLNSYLEILLGELDHVGAGGVQGRGGRREEDPQQEEEEREGGEKEARHLSLSCPVILGIQGMETGGRENGERY